MPYQLSLSQAVSRAAREIGARRDLGITLQTIVVVAGRSMPGIDHVGVTLMRPQDRLEAVAVTGQLVRSLDHFQCTLGEGPCVDAIRRDRVVIVENARREHRWPRYIQAAVRAGLRSQLALRLSLDADETLGSLNMYSTTSDTIPPETRRLARLFAVQVTVVLKHVLLEETLNTALQSEPVVETAVAVVMACHGLDNEQAFAYLTRVSQHSNVTLKEAARAVVAGSQDGAAGDKLVRAPRADRGGGRPRRHQDA